MAGNITLILTLLNSFPESSLARSLNMCNATSQVQSNLTFISYYYHGRPPDKGKANDWNPTPGYTQNHIEMTSIPSTTDVIDPPLDTTTPPLSTRETSTGRDTTDRSVRKKRSTLPVKDCGCELEAKTNVSIIIVKALSISSPEGAILNVGNKNSPDRRYEIKNYWNKGYVNPSETVLNGMPPYSLHLGVENTGMTPGYFLFLFIEGTITSINCSGRPDSVRNGVWPDNIMNDSDKDALNLLLMGGLLLVLIVVILLSGIVLRTRYILRKKKKETPQSEQRKSILQDTYEEISMDEVSCPNAKSPPHATKEQGSAGKSSTSKGKRNDPLSTGSHSRDNSVASISSGHLTETTSPASSKIKDFFGKSKGKNNDVSNKENTDAGRRLSNDSQEDYEDINKDELSSPSSVNIKVATPFLLAIKKGGAIGQLKKVDKDKSVDQQKAQSTPMAPLPSIRKASLSGTQSDYTDLDHSGRSKSLDPNVLKTYGDFFSGGDVMRGSRTAEVSSANKKKFKFTASSGLQEPATFSILSEDGEIKDTHMTSTNADDILESEDHIYEAFDMKEENAKKEYQRQNGLDSEPVEMSSLLDKVSGKIPRSQVDVTTCASIKSNEVKQELVPLADGEKGRELEKVVDEDVEYSTVDEEDDLESPDVKEMDQRPVLTADGENAPGPEKVISEDEDYSIVDENNGLKSPHAQNKPEVQKVPRQEKVVNEEENYSIVDENDGLKSPQTQAKPVVQNVPRQEKVVHEEEVYSIVDENDGLKSLHVQDKPEVKSSSNEKGLGFTQDSSKDIASNVSRTDQIRGSSFDSDTGSHVYESTMEDGQDRDKLMDTGASKKGPKDGQMQRGSGDLSSYCTDLQTRNSGGKDDNTEDPIGPLPDLTVYSLASKPADPPINTLPNGESQTATSGNNDEEEAVLFNTLYETYEFSSL